MAEIRLRNLAHSYLPNPTRREDFAIREMNHVWEKGGAYALLGPSGCGKSTMLNLISGLMVPSHGEVIFNSVIVNDLSPKERNIAQVFQFPVVYDTMSVHDNLAFPLRNVGTAERAVRQRVAEIAETLDLTPLLKRKARNLTADEKQKVSMGRGLVRDDVSAILFDEPLTVIDPQLKWRLRRKLKQIHEQFDITMIYVTHDQLEAATFAERIAVMYDGQIVQFGTPLELFERPAHTFVGYFIGSPGMNLLPVQRDGDGLSFEGQPLPLSAERLAAGHRAAADDRLTSGIRPEFVELIDASAAAAADCLVLPISDVEDLGTYRLVSLQLGSMTIKARVGEDQHIPDGRAGVRMPASRLELYINDLRVEA